MEFKDYDRVLGANRNANNNRIKQAHRQLAHKYHPDKELGDRGVRERSRENNELHTVPAKRQCRVTNERLGSKYHGNWRVNGQAGTFSSPWSCTPSACSDRGALSLNSGNACALCKQIDYERPVHLQMIGA